VFQEKQAVTYDGRAFSIRIMPYRTLDNVIDGVVITFTDTTAVRAMEIAAREQADQLRQMAESLPHLVFSARADGGFDFISRQWVDYTGVSDVEQLQWGWLDQLHTADRERVREEWRTALRTGTQLDIELRIRSATGTYRWFTTRAVPIRDASAAITRWYGSCTDIDQLKRAEDRLAGVLASIHDGFIRISKDLVILGINAVAERMLGCRAEDVIGSALSRAPAPLRGLADLFPQAPIDAELALGDARHAAHIERDAEGDYLIFLRTAAT
jgi:PAS domain S-box-containing protein